MTLDLPRPAANYFTGVPAVSDDGAECFTRNAIVNDEGHTYQGRAANRKWKADASTKYQYTCEPFACGQTDGRTVVTCRLTGNFPGSPVDLRLFFEFEGDKIASLEVIP